MEFKAEILEGEVKVKPIIERKPNGDVIIHVPSFPIIQKLIKEHGKRNIQQV